MSEQGPEFCGVDPELWEEALKHIHFQSAGEADWTSWRCGGGPHRDHPARRKLPPGTTLQLSTEGSIDPPKEQYTPGDGVTPD